MKLGLFKEKNLNIIKRDNIKNKTSYRGRVFCVFTFKNHSIARIFYKISKFLPKFEKPKLFNLRLNNCIQNNRLNNDTCKEVTNKVTNSFFENTESISIGYIQENIMAASSLISDKEIKKILNGINEKLSSKSLEKIEQKEILKTLIFLSNNLNLKKYGSKITIALLLLSIFQESNSFMKMKNIKASLNKVLLESSFDSEDMTKIFGLVQESVCSFDENKLNIATFSLQALMLRKDLDKESAIEIFKQSIALYPFLNLKQETFFKELKQFVLRSDFDKYFSQHALVLIDSLSRGDYEFKDISLKEDSSQTNKINKDELEKLFDKFFNGNVFMKIKIFHLMVKSFSTNKIPLELQSLFFKNFFGVFAVSSDVPRFVKIKALKKLLKDMVKVKIFPEIDFTKLYKTLEGFKV